MKTNLLLLEFKLFKLLCKLDQKLSASGSKNIVFNILVSGGKDSICLLYCLHTVLNSYKFKPTSKFHLIATHFNHKKRGKDSDEDELFVLENCLNLGIECYSMNISPTKKENFQNYARKERQRYAVEISQSYCNKNGYDLFFNITAHHKNDHVESVLLHLLRGSGLQGIQGFYGSQKSHTLKPFSNIDVSEILNYLETKKIQFRTDNSNLSLDYNRNLLRLSILPELKKINPKFEENILRFSKHTTHILKEYKKSQITTNQEFIFLPTTTSNDVYFYLKSLNDEDIDISENCIKNLIYEANSVRNSKKNTKKIISLKNQKQMTIIKLTNSKVLGRM